MRELSMDSLDDLDTIMRVIRFEWEKNGKPLNIVVKNADQSLRSRQRKLYWVWMTCIGNDIGYTNGEIHREMKYKFLVNIYMQNPDDHSDLAKLIDTLKRISGEIKASDYMQIKNVVLDYLSIMDASKDEMREYLTEIKSHAAGLQIHLDNTGEGELYE